MASVTQGGGADITDREGTTQGRHGRSSSTNTDTNPYNENRYQRLQLNDAMKWRDRRKRKHCMIIETLQNDETQNDKTIDPTILQIELTADDAYYNRWHVPRLGTMNSTRPDGVYRLMGAQLNSLSSAERRDKKVTEIATIMDTWEIQGGCFQEVGINWSATSYSRNMSSWFRLDRREIRTHTAHNTHEMIETSQQGGVAQFMCNELVTYAHETETDFRGLGRWSSWVLYANPNHKTRIITAYNLGKRKSNYLGTVYQQHLRFIQLQGWDITPHRLFMIDFLSAIVRWIRAGERLLIFADMNEHVLHGQLATQLLSMGLIEATHHSWGETEPNTHVSGSKPIDGVYHSSTLEITATMMLSFHEGVGDHRTTLVDVTARSLLGTDGYHIVKPAARRLTCSNKKSVTRFNKYVEKEITKHKLHERLVLASQMLQRNPQDANGRQMMETIDTQTTEILVAGEKQCRKFTKKPLPFSAPVAYWIHRKWAYQAMMRIAQGKCRNLGNARRRARKSGLDTLQLTEEQCADGIKICNNHLQQLKSQAIGLRKVHLRNCLISAEDANDKEKFKGILRVIEREEQKAMWSSIKRVTDDPRLGAITFVQQDTPSGRINITDMDEMCAEIQTVTEKRFELAESAPITNTSLRHSLGFLSDTKYALELVSGSTAVPEDVETTTKLVIEEMQRLWKCNGRERFKAFEITPGDYKYFWKHVKESTSSSISGLHFGIYKATTESELITSFISDKITVIGSYGCPPTRWGCGLQVMLEKVAGVALVNKLRAILLMEGDYNFFNKWVFGFKALNLLYEDGYIPQDQYSQRESTAEDARLDNRITMDISRQLRTPLVAVSVDADKCYDRINHIIMSLALLSIIGTGGLITALLHPIQTMKFYQRTAWGDSSTFMGGRTPDNPLQGLCQGNGAAPACWLIISSLLMHCYERQGFGSNILSPMSNLIIRFLGEMYVDDTDLIITQPHYRLAADLQDDAQTSVDAWANLLISTGGSLNPDKCYWYLVDYVCINGEWNYAPMAEWDITIPMPDGTKHPISQLDAHTSQKMLGVWSNPTGKDKKHLDFHVVAKYKTWVDRSTNGHLPSRLNWKSYKFKLWPSIRYGIATLATPTAQTSSLFQKLDYLALPLLGVMRSIKREWRNIPRAFGGIGLFNLTIEQMIGWSNMILQHFGAPSPLGQKMQATLEALQLEIGCIGNPLVESYTTTGILATPSWITSVWERTRCYNLDFHLDYKTLPTPRKNDVTIINLLLQNGISGMTLRQMNRCRIALQAIFLSDLATADGTHLETWVIGNRVGRHSKFKFPREEPSPKDWDLWDDFWGHWLQRNNTMPLVLGRWLHSSHQHWQWYFDNSTHTLWERISEGWVKYEFAQVGRNTRRNQTFCPVGLWMELTLDGLLHASVKDHTNNQVLMTDTGQQPPTDCETKQSFWEYVWSQGGTWMWDFVEGKCEDMSWIAVATQNNTAIMVTDGSYNRTVAPTISGAGWLLACTECHKMIRGSFYEESPKASSYRGELLGLTAIHHLVANALEFYKHSTAMGSMHCDNKGALHQASLKRRRVRTNAKHSDLLRNLRHIKGNFNFNVKYEHVKAHQDDLFAYDDLTMVQQFNVICDLLAKQAVQSSFDSVVSRRALSQLLPREQSALIIDDRKQTTDVATDLRFHLGMKEAKKFFTNPIRIRGETNVGGLGWTIERFDSVDWKVLHDVVDKKPDMYAIWLAKQTTGACATRHVVSRIQGSSDDRCPNCLVGPERSSHLNRCRDPGRSKLFEADVDELREWMSSRTDPELCYWITHYLLLRGEHSMTQLGDKSPGMTEIAAGFDLIGWEDILHGRLPRALHTYQLSYSASAKKRLTGTDWMRTFVTKLLNISHSQWLYRNFSLHDKLQGHLHLAHQAAVLEEIATLSTTQPEDIPEGSRFLLEVDLTSLDRSSLTQQEYWVTAMTAARAAGRRCARPSYSRPSTTSSLTCSRTSPKQRRDTNSFLWRIDQLLRKMREALDLSYGSWRHKRNRPVNYELTNGSNKRLRKPD